MTRIKKSRQSGPLAPRKLPKEQQDRTVVDPREKKRKGRKPGSRNSLEVTAPLDDPSANRNKDKRHGSKKPIELTPAKKVQPEPQLSNYEPQVKLKKVTVVDDISPEEELAAIEGNEELMALLERVEGGEVLQGKEAKFFNKHMDRYNELAEILGLDDEEEAGEVADPLSQFESLGWEDDFDSEKNK